jgi:hypothetical protein
LGVYLQQTLEIVYWIWMKRTLQVRSSFVSFVVDDGRGKSGGEWLEIAPVFSIRRAPMERTFSRVGTLLVAT